MLLKASSNYQGEHVPLCCSNQRLFASVFVVNLKGNHYDGMYIVLRCHKSLRGGIVVELFALK